MPESAATPRTDQTLSEIASARVVRRTMQQWPLVFICGVICAIAGYFVSSSRTKLYEATTTIQISDVDLAQVFTGQNLSQGQDDEAKAATNAKLVTLPRVLDAVSKALGGKVTTHDLESALKVQPTTGTSLVDISARNASPALAAQIANLTRESFINVRKGSAVAQLDQATEGVTAQLVQIPAAERHSASANVLRDRLQQIDTLRAVSTGGVETVQTASEPTEPVAPRPKRDAGLALFAGLLIGVGVAALRARLDDRVRTTDELAELWDLPVVGLVPETDGLRHSGVVLPDGPALEALSLARTNLRYLHVGGDRKTLILTSALEGEGKSTITWNLGLAAALAQSKVLVIEADLRRPVISSRLNVVAKQGLSEILAGLSTLDDAVVPVTVDDKDRHVSVTVDVLPAGLAPPSPVALLERPAMAELLDELRRRYDIVLIDTPPATIVADAMAFMDHVDGVLVVSRLGRLRRRSLARLRDTLEGIDAPVVGQIVNSGATAKAYGYTAYTRSKPTVPSEPLAPASAENGHVGASDDTTTKDLAETANRV